MNNGPLFFFNFLEFWRTEKEVEKSHSNCTVSEVNWSSRQQYYDRKIFQLLQHADVPTHFQISISVEFAKRKMR